MRKKILIADDDKNVIYSFRRILPEEYEILPAYSVGEAVGILKEHTPDIAIMDVRMPKMSGIEGLKQIRQMLPHLPVIIMTGYGSMETAVEAMKHEAFDYVVKPFDVDVMKKVIERALKAQEAGGRVSYPLSRDRTEAEDSIIGDCGAMQGVYKLIGQVAGKDVTVLITGESGTGKELVARAIHQHSHRAKGMFMAVNCAAIPETLLESELFGYEKGAFTGAADRYAGRFEQCHGGTMFLDEIGDMPVSTQTKILRVLQGGEFSRLGGKSVLKSDVRLITATNKDLTKAIGKGSFREDLYYRLNVIAIHLPSLRERKEDIPALVEYFIKKSGRESGKAVKGIQKEALKTLVDHDWPGNVRELENCIKRACILAKTSFLTPEDINIPGESVEQSTAEPGLDAELERFLSSKKHGAMQEIEKMLLEKALRRTRGNQVKAARLLGISRNTLRSRMKKYGIA